MYKQTLYETSALTVRDCFCFHIDASESSNIAPNSSQRCHTSAYTFILYLTEHLEKLCLWDITCTLKTF